MLESLPDQRGWPRWRSSILESARLRIEAEAPDLLSMFDVYAEEAKFAGELVAATLMELAPRASVLEVGAGGFLLSAVLGDEGLAVTAIEPQGPGFSHLGRIGELVLAVAEEHGCRPRVFDEGAERFDAVDAFDFAFSINVMEHVTDVAATIDHVVTALKPGATFRFICPNYAFPYEPHFNIPTLFSKRLTEKYLRRRIFDRTDLPDPAGTWASLNWITVSQVRAACRAAGAEATFSRDGLQLFVDRALGDTQFSERKGRHIVRAVAIGKRLRVFSVARLLPRRVNPVIDCSVVRRH